MFDKTSLLEKKPWSTRIYPSKSPKKAHTKTSQKNPRMIRKIERPLKKNKKKLKGQAKIKGNFTSENVVI